ncbi:MAG: hypothetical protein ABL957_05770 [Parvularculaceae bacterium]
MKRLHRTAILAFALAFSAGGVWAEPKAAEPENAEAEAFNLAGYEAVGKPKLCLKREEIRSFFASENGLVFKTIDGTLYVNQFQSECAATPEEGYLFKTKTSRICRNDVIYFQDIVHLRNACTFGVFRRLSRKLASP